MKVTGRTDEATLAAISVSVARTASGLYAPETSYDIVHLNFVLLRATASIWPRVDKDPRSTAELGAAIRQAISRHLTT